VKQSSIQILSSEFSWSSIRNLPPAVIYSPQSWKIHPDIPRFSFTEIDGAGFEDYNIGGVLWRERHFFLIKNWNN